MMTLEIQKPRRKRRKHQLSGQLCFFKDLAVDGKIYFYSCPALPRKPDEYNPEMEALMVNNLRIVDHLVNRLCWNNGHHNREEARQAGMIALWNAATRFDPERKVKFSTFAHLVVRHAILKFRYGKPPADTLSLEALREDGWDDLPSTDQAPEASNEAAESIALLHRLADEAVREKERAGILALAMQLEGFSPTEIAQVIGVSKSSYDATVSAGRKALRSSPKFLFYISQITGIKPKSVAVEVCGKRYVVHYAPDAFYNNTTSSSDDYLESFAEHLRTLDYSEGLPCGESVMTESFVETRFVVSDSMVEITSVANLHSQREFERRAARLLASAS